MFTLKGVQYYLCAVNLIYQLELFFIYFFVYIFFTKRSSILYQPAYFIVETGL